MRSPRSAANMARMPGEGTDASCSRVRRAAMESISDAGVAVADRCVVAVVLADEFSVGGIAVGATLPASAFCELSASNFVESIG